MENVDHTTPTKEELAQETHRREASTSMVLGIVGDCIVWYPILGVAGLVLCIFALIKSNRNKEYANENNLYEHSCNIAGRWCGIGGIIVGSILLILYLVAFALIILIALGFIQNSGILNALGIGSGTIGIIPPLQ